MAPKRGASASPSTNWASVSTRSSQNQAANANSPSAVSSVQTSSRSGGVAGIVLPLRFRGSGRTSWPRAGRLHLPHPEACVRRQKLIRLQDLLYLLEQFGPVAGHIVATVRTGRGAQQRAQGQHPLA